MMIMGAALTAVLALGLLAAPLAAEAQQSGKLPVIGLLEAAAPALNQRTREAFRQGLEQHGWVEGRNVVIEIRAVVETERFREVAAELVGHRADVIVASGTQGAQALREATESIPIIFISGSDPVRSGLVTSLARPGGNATGLSYLSPELSQPDAPVALPPTSAKTTSSDRGATTRGCAGAKRRASSGSTETRDPGPIPRAASQARTAVGCSKSTSNVRAATAVA